MSTREVPPGAAEAPGLPAPVPAELRGAVLDPAVLGRLANEVFRALPGVTTSGSSVPAIAPSLGLTPAGTPDLGAGARPSAPVSAPAITSPPATDASFVGIPRIGAPQSPWPALPGFAPEVSGVALPFAPTSHPISSVPSAPPRAGALAPFGSPPVGAAPQEPSTPPWLGTTAPAARSYDVAALRELSPLNAGGASLGVPASTPTPPRTAPPGASTAQLGEVPYFLSEARLEARPDAPPIGPPAPTASPQVTALDPELLPALDLPHGHFDVHAVRRDFPILSERVHGKPLIWLDNAATTQKPRQVIQRIAEFYERENSNIHRAAHTLAARATDAYEAARDKVRRFLGASSTKEIVFVRGTTEGMNLIAKSWGARHVGAGDEIVLTTLEHHSNIVPWQQLAKEKGARLKVAPVDDSGQILLDDFERLFTPRTRLATFTQVSNALGTVLPVKEMTEIARRHGARVVIDGAQSVSHMPVDVQALGADFFVFSGHKIFGPTGIGVVYGRGDALDETPPWQGGGNMIVDVTFEKTIYAPVPARLEAGTGNIADAVGLGAALDYVTELGLQNIAAWEHELVVHATELLRPIPGLTLVGTAKEKASVVGFVLAGYEPHEVGVALDRDGIAVRAGHHCAQPALRRFGHEATVRPSIAFYNTKDEIEQLARSVRRLADARGGSR